MSQAGYTPISLYYSTTASAVPVNTNLVNGELALNITDKKLYAKDNTGTVFLLASASVTGTVTSVDVSGGTTGLTTSGGPVTTSGTITLAGTLNAVSGGTGLTSYAVGDILYANTTTSLAKLADVATGNALISGGVGTAPSWGKIGLTTHVSGILSPANGGTGMNNVSNTLTLTGNLVTSGGYNITLTGTGSTNITLPTSGTLATILPRVVNTASATSITINGDTTDIATMANTQTAGTFTVNAPSGTPTNGQKLIFRLSSTAVQTFSWNAIFQGSSDVALPTASSSGGKYDYMGFIYNSTASKWQMVASNFGF